VGQQNPCAQKHIAPPEGAEFRAAESLVFEPFCGGLLLCDHMRILGCAFDRRNDLVEDNFDGGLRFGIQVYFCRLAVWISRLLIPVLAFAFVRWKPDGFARTEMKLLIDVEDSL